MIYTSAEQNCSATALCYSVCTVANIVCKPEGLPWDEMCLTLEANVDPVMAEEVIQLQPPALVAVSVPACQLQGSPIRPPRPCCHTWLEEDYAFQDSSSSGSPSRKVREGCEKPTSQLHPGSKREIMEKTRHFEGGAQNLLGVFLCASGSELVASLVSRHSLSPRVGVKNDANRRCIWCTWSGYHKLLNVLNGKFCIKI